MTNSGLNQLLEEQIAYYKARVNEYDEWFLRQGRYDRGNRPRSNASILTELGGFCARDAMTEATNSISNGQRKSHK
jgi:hypothetical protein